jgi:hypothetical protein
MPVVAQDVEVVGDPSLGDAWPGRELTDGRGFAAEGQQALPYRVAHRLELRGRGDVHARFGQEQSVWKP